DWLHLAPLAGREALQGDLAALGLEVLLQQLLLLFHAVGAADARADLADRFQVADGPGRVKRERRRRLGVAVGGDRVARRLVLRGGRLGTLGARLPHAEPSQADPDGEDEQQTDGQARHGNALGPETSYIPGALIVAGSDGRSETALGAASIRTRMTRIERINTDLIRANPFNPCHPCSIFYRPGPRGRGPPARVAGRVGRGSRTVCGGRRAARCTSRAARGSAPTAAGRPRAVRARRRPPSRAAPPRVPAGRCARRA